jgi:hypothetical protein
VGIGLSTVHALVVEGTGGHFWMSVSKEKQHVKGEIQIPCPQNVAPRFGKLDPVGPYSRNKSKLFQIQSSREIFKIKNVRRESSEVQLMPNKSFPRLLEPP